ncbi:MAG TPA: peptidoglycan DD-metalloendopeptidase family protein [Acidimicrobiales bacterium]|nr:peptidoglycan DD-metalloendopeptidase family protein [Acidimicrobiales bacterium]
MRRLAVLVALPLALVLAAPSPAAAAPPERVTYRPPVDAPITDPFRPPAERWGAGNRGLEYATTSGEPVAAAAGGVVAFAGQVGGRLHVVVLHGDGVRTTSAFLRSIEVRRGDTVRQGERVGTAAEAVHFGARIGEVYVDPVLLFGDGPPEVHLVPDAALGIGSEEQERTGLFGQLLEWGGSATTWAVDWAVDWAADWVAGQVDDTIAEVMGAAHYLGEANPLTHVVRLGAAGVDWWRQRADCTPEEAAQPRLRERHLAVLVGGLGSSSSSAAIDDLDTTALGYGEGDVSRFSYRGGSTEATPYQPADTVADLRRSARLFREYLQAVAAEHPGVPIDVIAHSQGGIVAREALTNEFDGLDPSLPQVSSLVTLGSPHQGADLATAAAMFGFTTVGEAATRAVGLFAPWDPRGPSVGQLSETSSFIRDLNDRPLPEGLHATSIAARSDLIVAAGRTSFAGAENVVVAVPGTTFGDHAQLPGSDQGEREVALAVNHMAPTCQRLADAVVDALVAGQIGMVEDAAGMGAWLAGRKIDKFIPSPWELWKKKRGSS